MKNIFQYFTSIKVSMRNVNFDRSYTTYTRQRSYRDQYHMPTGRGNTIVMSRYRGTGQVQTWTLHES